MNIFDPQISGSLSVSGSGQVSGDLTVLGTLFATISGTAENAVSASHAASYTLTSSFHQFTSSYNTGSFTGSFSGNGSGLYNIPASGVTGLNLSQISEGNATASISQANGLLINTNTEITGNLKVNNINVGTNGLVTVSVTDSAGKYFIDNVRNPQLTLVKGFTYKFLFPNIGAHPFRFSTTNDGTHNGGVIYSTGVTTGATPDYIQIVVTDTTPSTLYYFCTSHPGMGSGISVQSDLLNLEADRNVVYIDPSRIATTGSNSLTGSQTISGSLSVTGSVNITGSISLNGQPIGTGKLDETIFNTYTSSNDSRVSALEVSTGSLNTFTSSINTTIKNKMDADGVVSGAIQISITGTTDFTSFSTSISQSISRSLLDSKNYTDQQIGLLDFATPLTALNQATASLNSYTSSNTTNINAIHTATSSLNSYTSSNTTNINAIHTATSSLNSFSSSILGAVEVTGSNLTIKGNLLVKGTTTQIDSTTVNIGDNIIQLNGTGTNNAGLVVQDPTAPNTASGSLLWDSTSDYWKAGQLGTEERIILNNEYNTFSTSIDSRVSSIQEVTSSNNSRLNSLEISTSSLNTFTSSTNTKLSSLETASSSIRSDFNSYTSSTNTRLGIIETSTGSLNTFTTSVNNSLSAIHTATSSLNSYTSSTNVKLNAIETSTGSLNTFTSSANNKLTSLETASGSIRTDFNSYTSSNDSTNTTQNNRLNAIETSTSSLNSYTSSQSAINNSVNSTTASLNSYTSSTNTRLGVIESTTSSLNSYTSSTNTRIASIETATSSLNSFTSSINTTIKNRLNAENVISGSAQVTLSSTTGYSTFSSSLATTDAGQDSRLNSLEGKTGSYATTGSNVFQGSQTITGSLYISQDLIVGGSSSINFVSQSTLNIGTNLITVNAQNPSTRFGGLAVIDSGSSPQVSGSMLFDSVNDQWIFVHQNQSAITSSILLMGPQTTNNLGGESYLTLNRVPKGTGIEHLNDSNITDTGTKVSINSNTEVTGTLIVTQNITSPNITAIQIATGSLNSYTSSLQTAIELTGSNLTIKGNLLVKGTTTNVNTTTLDVDNNLINLNGNGASFAGLRVKDTTAPNQVSGSLLWDATNDYWIAGQLGSEQRIVRETEFNNAVTRIGNVETSTGSLNSYTSSNNTRLGVIESTTSSLNTFTSSANGRLNSLESASSSIRTDFNSYTSSNNSTNTTQNNRLNSIESTTGSLNTFTSSASSKLTSIESSTSSLNSYTSSNTTNINAIHTATSSLNSYTSSNNTRLGVIEATTASLNSFTSSTGGRLSALETSTGSLNSYTSSNTTNINAIHTATSSLNSFTNSFNSAFSLSGADVTVKGNFTVSGTTTTVNSTTVNIADNIIQLNGTGATNAGLVVRDATSPSNASGSLLWDTTSDKWIAGVLGSEDDIVLRTTSQTLTNKTISGASNTLSNIGNSSLTNSSITIANTSTSLGGSISAATIGNAIGAFSGSAQVALTGTTGFGTYIDQALLTTSSPTHASLTITGRAQIGGTDSRGVLTVQTGSTQTYTANTDPTDAGRFFVMQNTSTTNAAGQYSNITLQINPGGSIGSGRVLGDIRLVRNSLNGTSARFVFSAFRDDATYKDYLSLDFAGATFAGTINGLTVSTGTITSGTWNGSSISTTYTDAKLTSVAGTTNQVNVSASTGAVTFSLPQSIHTAATPTFGGLTLSGTGTGNAPTLRVNNSSASSFNHSIEAFAANTTAGQTNLIVVGVSGSTKNAGYLGYNWSSAGSNSNYVSLGHWGADNLLRVYGDGTVYMGTVTTGVWNGTSIGTAYTDAKVTSVSAGTGVSVNQTTGAVTVSIGQSVATSASPTFADATLTGGLTVGGSLSRGTYTTASNYVTGADNIVLKGNSSGVSGIFFESEKDGTNINHPSDFGFIQFHPYGIGGSSGEANRLVIGVSNDADDMIVLNPMDTNGVKVRVGTGTTEYSVYHSGNLTNLNQLTNGPGYITGNQSISISGDASGSGTTSISLTVSQIQGRAFRNTGSNEGVNANSLDANGTTYVTNVDGSSTNLTGNATDGALYSQVYSSSWQHQIYGDYRTGIMYARGKNNGTWQSWKRVALSNSTTFSNVSSVSFTHNLGTANLTAQVFDSSGNMFFPSEINITSTTVTVTFAANRTGRLVVTG